MVARQRVLQLLERFATLEAMDVEVDLRELGKRLAPIEVTDLRSLRGGASSLTYTGTVGAAQRVVVKVAPAGVPPVRNRDVLRQARVLRALHPTAVPVPEVLWEDAGDPPEVPPLFVMSFVEGTSLEPLFDRDGEESGEESGGEAKRSPGPTAGRAERSRLGEQDQRTQVAERMRNAARTMAALHALQPPALGLGDEPFVGPGDEIDRWCRVLETVDPALAPGWEAAAAALRAGEPEPLPAALVHGDFRLGNTLAVRSRIAAVVDWEIWSVGDPRVDLGWFLVSADPDTYRRGTRYAGSLPTPAELARIYGAARGREVPDLDWFQALACFKSTATWALIVKHNRRRAMPEPAMEEMADTLPHLLDRARALLG